MCSLLSFPFRGFGTLPNLSLIHIFPKKQRNISSMKNTGGTQLARIRGSLPNRAISVSYTHLDVYKRQDMLFVDVLADFGDSVAR